MSDYRQNEKKLPTIDRKNINRHVDPPPPAPHSGPLLLQGVDFYERFFTYKVDFCEDWEICKELCYI